MAENAKKADWKDWAYRTALGAVVVWGVNWLGGKIDTLSGLPGQVKQLVTDVDTVKKAQADMKAAQDEMKRTQSGFATGADVQNLTSRVDNLTGRVDTMETTVNSLVRPAPKPR